MNKILKLITTCFVLPASFLCASSQEVQDEKQNDYSCIENSFGYINIGAGEFLLKFEPSVGLGYRIQKGQHGFDVSGSIGYLGLLTTRVNVLYNYFFKPNLEKQFFAGLGLGVKNIHLYDDYFCGGSMCMVRPVFAVGQEFKTKAGSQCIVQLQVAYPNYAFTEGFCIYPEVTISYGFGF